MNHPNCTFPASWVAGALAAVLIVAPHGASSADPGAAEQSVGALQEIIVTATRREESLSKVPLSVSAITQDHMDALGIRDIVDVARFTPGVAIDGQSNGITIRGIGSSAGAATTGIYIDDSPIQERALSRGSQAVPKTFDLDRIEILRGPQGTLFGAGSEGGTVRYIMTQPSLTKFSAYGRSEVSYTEGGSPSYEAGVAAGGPVLDGTLGIRASAWYRRDGGWIDRVDPFTYAGVDKNANHEATRVMRLAAAWAPTYAVTVTPSIQFEERQIHDQQTFWQFLSNPGSNDFVSASPNRVPENDRYSLSSLKVSADFKGVQFISNTSYFHRTDDSGYDGTLFNVSYYQTLGWLPDPASGATGSTPYVPFGGSQCPTLPACYPFLDGTGVHLPPGLRFYGATGLFAQSQDVYTQEFRLQSDDKTARVVWTVGAFFSTSRTTSFEQIKDPAVDQFFEDVFGTNLANALGQQINPDGSTYLPGGNSYQNYLTGHDRQIAGFGEAVWGITNRLKLTTGFRYSKTDFTSTSYSDGATNYGPYHAGGEQHEKPITKRVGLSFQQDPANLYYGTFSTGFRPGGANAPVPAAVCAVDFQNFGITGAPASYDSDTVTSFELGAKNGFGNRIKLASSVYYVKWNHIQQGVLLPNCALGYTANLGTAVSKGFDIQADIAITDSLTVETAIGYTNAKYVNDLLAGPGATTPIVAKGDAIVTGLGAYAQPLSPWTAAVGIQYRFHAFDHPAYARLDYEYAFRNRTPSASEDPNTVQYDPFLFTPSSTTFVSMRAGTTIGELSLAVFIDNLLDSHTLTSVTHSNTDGYGPQPPASPLYTYTTFRPRTFGVTLTYRR